MTDQVQQAPYRDASKLKVDSINFLITKGPQRMTQSSSLWHTKVEGDCGAFFLLRKGVDGRSRGVRTLIDIPATQMPLFMHLFTC